MKTIFTLKDLVKYTIFVGIVYTLIKMIPSTKLCNKDTILIVLIIGIGFVLLDCFNSPEKFQDITVVNNTELEQALQQQLKLRNMDSSYNQIPSSVPELYIKEDTYYNTLPEDNKESDTLLKELIDNKNNKLQEVAPTNVSSGCSIEIDKLKSQLLSQVNTLNDKIMELSSQSNQDSTKYLNYLITDLVDLEVLTKPDVDIIMNKIDTKLLTVTEVITSLEKLKLSSNGKVRKNKDNKDNKDNETDLKYNELPAEFSSALGDDQELAKWDTNYSMLNTNKWQVPMPRPPVCINTSPCKVCPTDEVNYPMNLKNWHESRKFTNTNINKDWANDQTNTK